MAINIKELEQILNLAQKSQVKEFELTTADYTICVRNQVVEEKSGEPLITIDKKENNIIKNESVVSNEILAPKNIVEEQKTIVAPMLGTFYRRSSPEVEVFVEVGSSISAGQVVCIIEAMKIMYDVKAEQDGIVREICVKDGEMVEYGQTLFILD